MDDISLCTGAGGIRHRKVFCRCAWHCQASEKEKKEKVRSETNTIIGALRGLARDIQTDDGVVNACLDEAARRMEELQDELETERMRLAACGVVAMANNAKSASNARVMNDKYRSASLDDVIRAVDAEMRYRDAIEKTLAENGHLADGENCTLIDLKLALRGDPVSQWVRIDYANPDTWPIEARPCIVAWDKKTVIDNGWGLEAMTNDGLNQRITANDDACVEGNYWMWADCYSGDFEEWADDCQPTHWCYAPQFEGAA